jgi:urease gamma subunit
VSSGANQSTYKSNDGLISQTVSSLYGKRVRRTLRLDHAKVAADPFVTGVNTKYSMSAYVVVDVPTTGYTVAEAKAVVDGLMTILTASTGAKITQLLGGEN